MQYRAFPFTMTFCLGLTLTACLHVQTPEVGESAHLDTRHRLLSAPDSSGDVINMKSLASSLSVHDRMGKLIPILEESGNELGTWSTPIAVMNYQGHALFVSRELGDTANRNSYDSIRKY